MPSEIQNLPLPYRRLQRQGRRAWSTADRLLRGVTTPDRLRAAQADARARFDRLYGPLPDVSAPVESRITGRFDYENIAIHRIVIRSSYGYDITGWSLRRTDLEAAIPGVAVAAGHVELGSLTPRYLEMAMLLARSGMHAVSFDPPGQGARREVLRPEDHPVFWDPCKQHMHMGMATTLAGLSLPHFFVADAMTVVSHLCSHPGVDSTRIGFTGQSGGGIQTFYMMGADPRIAAAVTSQATSTRRGAFETVCSRDMCQMCLDQWSGGIDQHEHVLLFAPRPVRIIAEYGYPDQLDVYQKLQPIYEAVGHADNIELVSGSVEHRLNRACRELTLGWLTRHLQPDTPITMEPQWRDFDALHAAMRKSIESENAEGKGIVAYCQSRVAAQRAKAGRPRSALRTNPYLRGALTAKTRPILDAKGRPVRRITSGRYTCALQPDYHIPFTVHAGRGRELTAVIADQAGAASPWARHWTKLARTVARRVVTIDVFECGELATNLRPINEYHTRNWQYYGANHHAQDALMAGRCSIGLAMEEVATVLKSAGLSDAPLLLIGRGWPALALSLLASARDNVQGCCLSIAPESYEALLRAGYQHVGLSYIVPGLVAQTDWPQLIQADPAARYAICQPIRIGAPTAAYDDPRQFPNVRLFEHDSAAARRKALAFLADR